ncbi:probable Na(+)/H(+) antiporter nhx-9 isoform X2 [Mya arenaria]|uniref:probable Na(+)/H(+) antiporter nhx-9 isoform X2 n=1 Tax=Mya arenaria TaxID=6604 RepID=UPI0022DFF031|nr:probable Na(+)/H(+) antiporter nhx-9 isoform X2 [Mya arenaria]
MEWTGIMPKKRLSLLALGLCTCIILSLGVHVEASGGSKNETKSERYPLVVFDFARIELPFVICVWILIACLSKIAFHLNSKLPTVVPESCLLIVLGLAVGCILHFSHVASTSEYVLDANVFFIYLLPPIIFDAGYFMPIRPFFDNVGSVLLMAVVNTAFNTVAIGVSLWAVSLWGLVGRTISLLHCLIFSALISAVDPVAVISVFEEVHVNEMLYIIVFGESLLNDGVTVVLYHMMEGFIELGEDNIIPIDVVTGFGSFLIIALGGSIIGILYGLFGGFITKYTDHVKVIEPLFVFVLGYLMYLTSEMCHLSGILALSFGGIVLRHYMEHNVSKKTAVTIKYFMKMLANISETIIFMFLGLSTIVDTLDWNLSFIFFALFFCLVYRIMGVAVLAWCLNRRRLIKLGFIDQFIMAYGGLRGGIAFCLALSLEEELVPEKPLFVTATIMIVFFTVFVQGISIKPVVNALKVPRQPQEDPSLNEKIHETMLDHLMAGIEDLTSHSSHNLMRTRFRRFNTKYLQPMLCKEPAKPHAAKIVNVHFELTEQDAIKRSASIILTPTVLGSSADLYDDHKRALIESSAKRSAVISMDRDEDSIAFQHALYARQPRWSLPHNRHTLADSQESVDRVVYHRNPQRRVSNTQQPTLTNGAVQRSTRKPSHTSASSESEFAAVTINFSGQKDTSPTTTTTTMHPTAPSELPLANVPPTTNVLPWQEISDPSPTHHLAHSIPNDEPVIAHVPSWVNNLSYSHITETGSPYVSPQTTVIPIPVNEHKNLFTLFPELNGKGSSDENNDDSQKENENQVTCSDNFNFPTPWGTVSEDNPIVSYMPNENGTRTDNYLHSAHNEQAPDHHHVIIPTNEYLQIESSNSSCKHNSHLTEVASAPDLKHWRPIAKSSRSYLSESDRMQSDTMLSEMAFIDSVKGRIQDWLKVATDDEDNDADEEDEDGDDEQDGLAAADEIEKELDKAMSMGKKQ